MTSPGLHSFAIPAIAVIYYPKNAIMYLCLSMVSIISLVLLPWKEHSWALMIRLAAPCACTSLFLAPLCMLSSTTSKEVLRGPQMPVERSFLYVWNDVFSGGSKASSCPFPAPGELIPLMTRSCCSLTLLTQAPIDAHHPSSTVMRTQADWLQLHNDDKSHKHCQRHSDSKKHPLKIHPGHIASYFKHSPTPHLGPEFLRRRLITAVITFAVPHLF